MRVKGEMLMDRFYKKDESILFDIFGTNVSLDGIDELNAAYEYCNLHRLWKSKY